jgi:hypothetical protein
MKLLHMPKELNGLSDHVLSHYIGSQQGRVPMHVWAGRAGNEGGVGGARHIQMMSDLARGVELLLS